MVYEIERGLQIKPVPCLRINLTKKKKAQDRLVFLLRRLLIYNAADASIDRSLMLAWDMGEPSKNFF